MKSSLITSAIAVLVLYTTSGCEVLRSNDLIDRGDLPSTPTPGAAPAPTPGPTPAPGPTPGSTPTPEPNSSLTPTPTPTPISGSPGLLTTTGVAVSDIGNTVGTSEQLSGALGADTTQALDSTVSSLGTPVVGTLGNAISVGAGTVGQSTDPVGDTVRAVPTTTDSVTATVDQAAGLVNALGSSSSPLAPLNPITTPLGDAVSTINESAVKPVIGGVNSALTSDQLQPLTSGLSQVVNPVTDGVSQVTTELGSAGLNQVTAPVLGAANDSLLAPLGDAITSSEVPVISSLGQVITQAGDTANTANALFAGNEGAPMNPTGTTLQSVGGQLPTTGTTPPAAP